MFSSVPDFGAAPPKLQGHFQPPPGEFHGGSEALGLGSAGDNDCHPTIVEDEIDHAPLYRHRVIPDQ
jgi:hypothetical protein